MIDSPGYNSMGVVAVAMLARKCIRGVGVWEVLVRQTVANTAAIFIDRHVRPGLAQASRRLRRKPVSMCGNAGIPVFSSDRLP